MDESLLRFTETHEWIYLDGEICTIGITRFAVDALTDITYLELAPVGKRVTAGSAFGVVESVKSTSDLYLPVTGQVVEVNQAVVDDPALLNEDPYEKGWLIRVQVGSTLATTRLMDKAAYDAKCAAEEH